MEPTQNFELKPLFRGVFILKFNRILSVNLCKIKNMNIEIFTGTDLDAGPKMVFLTFNEYNFHGPWFVFAFL